jgi:hypothetical protein
MTKEEQRRTEDYSCGVKSGRGIIPKEKKGGRLKLWSVEGKRSDDKGRAEKGGRLKLWSIERKRNNNKRKEGRKIKVVECRGKEE